MNRHEATDLFSFSATNIISTLQKWKDMQFMFDINNLRIISYQIISDTSDSPFGLRETGHYLVVVLI